MSKQNEVKIFKLIKERYFQIDKNFNKLIGNCKTDIEKKNLKRDYIIARSNYIKSLNVEFDNNDPVVKELANELTELEERIKKDIQNTENISNVLKMISESVKIASSIIVIVSSLI